MKKQLLAQFILFISLQSFAQTESFDSGAFPPSTPFSISNPIGLGNAFTGNVQWYRSDDVIVNGTFQNNGLDVGYNGSGNCVVMNSEEWCCGWQADLILSNINMSAYTAPRLKFYVKHPDGNEELYIDVNGGTGYSNYGSILNNYTSWTPIYIDLSAFAGNPSVSIRFRGVEGGGSSGITNLGIDEIVVEQQTAMTYVSSTTAQTGCNMFQGGNDQPLMRIEVVTQGSLNPLFFNSMTFNANGTTNPNEITTKKLYYTGNSSSFNTSYLVGSSIILGNYTINGAGVTLSEGTNYFWLAYDVPYSATYGNSFDAECLSIDIGTTQTPTITAPAGVLTLNNSNIFYVTNLNNTGPGSLRSAMAAANAYGCDAIVDARGVTGTIVHGNSINVSSSHNITLLGPGADRLTIDGGSSNFIYHYGSGKFTIEGFRMETFTSEPIYSPYGNIEVRYCWFNNNNESGCYFPGGDAIIRNSTFSNNVSAYSGAIYFPSQGTMEIYNSTFYNNFCSNSGGAIYNPYGTIVLENCTFKDNFAATNQGGGAIKNYGTVIAKNTSFDNNDNPGSGKDVYGAITMNNSHISSSNGATISGGSNILDVAANMGILALNGGLTPTCALSPGSPLIDGGGSTLLFRDQRDYCRTSQPDIGAFEFSASPSNVPLANLTLTSNDICENETITVTATTTNVGANPNFYWLINGQVVASGTSSSYTFNGIGLPASNYIGVIVEVDNTGSSCPFYNYAYGEFESFTVKPNPILNASASADSLCEGEILTLQSNATPQTATVTWDNNVVDNNPFIPLTSGMIYYTVMANLNGCMAYDTAIVVISELPDPQYTVQDATCGQDNGSITITSIPNATGPFTYLWTNGDNTAIADSLAAGLYQVNIISNAGCENDVTIYVNNSSGPSITGQTITNVTCPQGNNGSIDITVTGGSGSLTYQWNTGSIVQDISGLPAGVYDVSITDTSGCQAAATFVVTQPQPIVITYSSTLPTCGNNDGSITVNVNGGTPGYTYLWNPSSQTTATASSLASGIYQVLVTDANNCTKTKNTILNNGNGPDISLDSIFHVACGGSGGGIYVSVNGGSTPYTYAWSNSAITEDISGLLPGNYSLTVTDGGGCTGVFDADIVTVIPDEQPICMVTVDSLTQTNLVIWEKQIPANGIEYYNIYREGSVPGDYLLVDTVQYNSNSQFTDLVANPQVRAWRYKISAVDSCGNESVLSDEHKTIHLSANLGVGNVVNLSWGDYEGFSYPTYYINRYHTSTGWMVLDSLPNTLFSFTDPNPPVGTPDYAITINAPNGCDPSRAGVNTSRSNIKNQPVQSPSGISEKNNTVALTVYPNPARTELFIIIENYKGNAYVKLFNSVGQVLITETLTTNKIQLDVRNLPNGIYTVEVVSKDHHTFKKVIINK